MTRTQPKERVFLDANVLYSAAYLENSGLRVLWKVKRVELLSSPYAIEEARRNLGEDLAAALPRLNRLLNQVGLIEEGPDDPLPDMVRLDSEDRPILLAAIRAGADHLLTGDKRHFGHLYGKTVQGVAIARPAEFLRSHRRVRRPR